MTIGFADLFAGIGGFHATASAYGWEPKYVCDIDADARKIYELNWKIEPAKDIETDANDSGVSVPKHEVLFAGFPCQPFSKSGKQHGMEEARGTLFWNIAKILEVRRPRVVLLENVPNLAGPRHRHEWEVIISTLRELGYRVSDTPLIVSPHKVSPKFGGRPQTRSRIYIAATFVPANLRKKFPLDAEQLNFKQFTENWQPTDWSLLDDIQIERSSQNLNLAKLKLTESEKYWIDAWQDFLERMLKIRKSEKLPGFPFWADVWLGIIKHGKGDPAWKTDFITKNKLFYNDHKREIDSWLKRYEQLEAFPPSRRKFEWQAGDNKSIWNSLIQLRPSGIRVKKMNYVPAAVAITQTTVVGKLKRRLSVGEVAQLQGFPAWFSFGEQSSAKSYKQLGNGISLSTSYLTIKALVERDAEILKVTSPEIYHSVTSAPVSHDLALAKLRRT
jgi:DNA (cytosine-5)-methyltransferase 1